MWWLPALATCWAFQSLLVNFVVRHVKKMVPPWSLRGVSHFGTLGQGLPIRSSPYRSGRDDPPICNTPGGTTGVAKGAMLTHGNIVANPAAGPRLDQPLREGKARRSSSPPCRCITSSRSPRTA